MAGPTSPRMFAELNTIAGFGEQLVEPRLAEVQRRGVDVVPTHREQVEGGQPDLAVTAPEFAS